MNRHNPKLIKNDLKLDTAESPPPPPPHTHTHISTIYAMNQTCKTEITDVLTHLADAGFQCMLHERHKFWVNYWFFFQLNQSFSHKQNHPRERGRCSLKDDGTRQSSSLLKNSLTPPALSLFLSPSFSHTHTHTHTRSSSIYTRNSIMTLNQNSSCASIVNDGKPVLIKLK